MSVWFWHLKERTLYIRIERGFLMAQLWRWVSLDLDSLESQRAAKARNLTCPSARIGVRDNLQRKESLNADRNYTSHSLSSPPLPQHPLHLRIDFALAHPHFLGVLPIRRLVPITGEDIPIQHVQPNDGNVRSRR
jgi:hypothetical protein